MCTESCIVYSTLIQRLNGSDRLVKICYKAYVIPLTW
jgi:hypothetical protein